MLNRHIHKIIQKSINKHLVSYNILIWFAAMGDTIFVVLGDVLCCRFAAWILMFVHIWWSWISEWWMTSLSLDSSYAEAPDHSLSQRPGPEQLWSPRSPLLFGPQQWHQSLLQVRNRDLTGRLNKKKKHGTNFCPKAAGSEVGYGVVLLNVPPVSVFSQWESPEESQAEGQAETTASHRQLRRLQPFWCHPEPASFRYHTSFLLPDTLKAILD